MADYNSMNKHYEELVLKEEIALKGKKLKSNENGEWDYAYDLTGKKPTNANPYLDIGVEIGKLVQQKNVAYGDSFGKSEHILSVLYPDGVKPEQYRDLLTITRVVDKLFRIANDKDALDEDPWRDICGYAILAIKNQQ